MWCSTAAHAAGVINGAAGAHADGGNGQVTVNHAVAAATAAGSTGTATGAAAAVGAVGELGAQVTVGAAAADAAGSVGAGCGVGSSKNTTRTSTASAITMTSARMPSSRSDRLPAWRRRRACTFSDRVA